MKNGHRIVGNITDCLRSQDFSELLAVNGFSQTGSDYDVFRRFCICIDRSAESGQVQLNRALFQAFFAIDLPVSLESCQDIWRTAACALFNNPISAQQFQHSEPFFSVSVQAEAATAFPGVGIELSELPIAGFPTWEAWLKMAEEHLLKAVDAGKTPMLTLPSAFQATKPNLYRIERMLKGEEENMQMWLTQVAFFLFRFAQKQDIKPLLCTRCSVFELQSLLEIVSALTPLHSFLWQPEALPQWKEWASISQIVLQNRNPDREGEIPVLLCKYTERGCCG